MHLLSVAHLQSSLLGGFGLAPTQKWWLEMGNWQEVIVVETEEVSVEVEVVVDSE